MAESEQLQRHVNEKATNKRASRGQNYAFIICLLILVAAISLILRGLEPWGIAMIVAAMGPLIVAFMKGKIGKINSS